MKFDVKFAAKDRAMTSVERFTRDEDGHIVPFTVVMLTLMLTVAGMGLDIIQFETHRTKMQQTLDRATLAAASLTQELDAEDVVYDYFAKANLSETLRVVNFERTMNSSTVYAEADMEITPTFFNMYDFENDTKLVASAKSSAEQAINNIEIMLVLDVSGSMSGTKLNNLKSAATEFIDTVLEQDNENRVSIGIVPYNGQVNMPQYLQNLFTARQDDHNVADVNCFDLPAATYASLGLPTTTAMPVTAHADTFSGTSTGGYIAPTDGNAIVAPGNRWCPPSTVNVVRAPTNNATQLKNHINGFTAIGATSINAGLKWGLALLDPSSSNIIDGMIAAGQTPGYFGSRPAAYDDEDAMKIIVLMTDGEHFAEERMNAGYRSGNSPIWRHTDGRYSVFHNRANTNNDWYYPHNNSWNAARYGGNNAVQQTWPQLWNSLRVSYVAQQFWARPGILTQTNAMNMFRTQTPVANMNTQLQTICAAGKARDVVIYGIAFEAPAGGRTQIENCASSPSHYFESSGLEIRTAFRSIATNISQLKLTQ